MNSEKKTVSVVVPVYNEQDMIEEIFQRVDSVFTSDGRYNYELVFFDDGSTDGTRGKIKKLCENHSNVKSVFYAKNSGYLKNTFYAVQQAKGDCAILLHADLQNPPEKIPEFIDKWENGAQVVLGVKNKSRENKLMYFMRTVFYFVMIHIFGIKLTPHATEFELFDKSFIGILKKLKPAVPFLRGIVLEYASSTEVVYFTQDMRKKGKSKFNLNKYYDFAICGIVQYSKILPRRIIIFSLIIMLLLFAEFFVLCLPGIIGSDYSVISAALFLRLTAFIFCILLIIIALMWEFVIFTLKATDEKPLVIEEQRINY